VIEVADPSAALASVLRLFHPARVPRPGIHPTAVVDAGAFVDPTAEIGPFAVVGEHSRVETNAIVDAHAVVGARCRVGAFSWIHPHAVLYDDVRLGDRVEIHSGAVLGADGFGYATTARGLEKIPQVGGVTIGDDVEVGANACIDRAALEDTQVGAGTKIDDLVMLGHNVRVGRHDVLCAQVGIAGSSVIGDGVILGGQVGVAGHIKVGNGVKVQAQSGIGRDVPDGEALHGSPAIRYRDYQRSHIEFSRLPETARLVRRLAEKAGLLKGAAE
jgi:UDP-3-O-[3-hydroxymyristoyl] glucosamine N-acyltransferase